MPFAKVIRARYVTVVAIALALLSGIAAHATPVQARHLTVDLVARDNAFVPGKTSLIGLAFQLDPGWHVYWSNAGDSGEPPEVKWKLPDGITAAPFEFPAPKRLPLGPLMDFGYEDKVLFPVPLQIASSVATGKPATISGDVRWLVCREVCVPGQATLTLDLPVQASTTPNPITAETFQRALDSLPKPLAASDHVDVHADAKNFYITLRTSERESQAEFFPLDQSQVANAAPQTVTPSRDGIQITVRKDENLAGNPAQLRGVVVLGGNRAYLVAGTVVPGAPPSSPGQSTNSAELLRIVALAFLGGIILNLMPCVFPVLFIKGLGLLQGHGRERVHQRLHGLVYALGILVSFWAIVAVLLVLRSGGALFGWGFQFQSPTFVAIIALLLFFFALSLAGLFEIGLTFTSAGGELAQKPGYSGSFFTGMLATVVATPCTAPFMGAAVGFALSQSIAVTFLIFTALALGLAIPYVLLTFFPAWMRLLPKPGAWMEVLKQASSVPIFATVVWLVWLYARLAGTDLLLGLLAGMLLLAIAGWMLQRWVRSGVGTVIACAVVVIALAVPVYAQYANRTTKETWQPWTQQAVATARAQGRPVFVDFTAAWCLSCQFNERTVLNSKAVERAMDTAKVVRLRADWTHYDASITDALGQLGRSGVPTYVVYSSTANAPPDVLPEALTQSTVLDALGKLQPQQQSQHQQANLASEK
jgi:thiol:disulfide interchange protein DsbD